MYFWVENTTGAVPKKDGAQNQTVEGRNPTPDIENLWLFFCEFRFHIIQLVRKNLPQFCINM